MLREIKKVSETIYVRNAPPLTIHVDQLERLTESGALTATNQSLDGRVCVDHAKGLARLAGRPRGEE